MDYRLIVCCTILYKDISKLICSQLIDVLPNIIDLNQGAFIPSRSILHNILLSQELLKSYERVNISPRCLMKIDLKKTYDSVMWDFVFELLVELCSLERFIVWLRSCMISTVSYL